MAVTRLKRKDRRNKARASNRIARMKQLTRRPVIKHVEAEAPVSKTSSKKDSKTSSQEEE